MSATHASVLALRTRKPRMRRVQPHTALQLTGSQREVLGIIHEYGFLTVRLLAIVYGARAGRGGRGYWHLLRELRRLFDAGLVQRFPATATAVRCGSAECIYAITHQGARTVLDAVEYAAVRHDVYNREGKQRGNFNHHLAIASLQLVLTLGQGPWKLIEFRAEERNPGAVVKVRAKDRVLTAWPDAMALVESEASPSAPRRRTRYLFEIDLTRKNNHRVEDRFMVYGTHLADKSRSRPASPQTGSATERWLAVFAVAGEGEVERFIEIAGKVVSAWRPPERPVFLFWNLEDWYEQSGGALLPPATILKHARLTTVDGASRRLIEEGSSA